MGFEYFVLNLNTMCGSEGVWNTGGGGAVGARTTTRYVGQEMGMHRASLEGNLLKAQLS